jgi:hypothetical protein
MRQNRTILLRIVGVAIVMILNQSRATFATTLRDKHDPPIYKMIHNARVESNEATVLLTNNVLRVYISERNSQTWYYQYAPGIWGESNFHEHFAIHSPDFGIAESENFEIIQSFRPVIGDSGSVYGLLREHGIEIERNIVIPSGEARYFQINYRLTNRSTNIIKNLKFFQSVDFDVPVTGDHRNDYGWYDPTNDYIGVKDDAYFRNILVSVPRSDNHGVDFYDTQINIDWDDGELSGRNEFGPGDPGVAKQFNIGDFAPQQSRSISFYVWFGDPSLLTHCVRGQVTDSFGQPITGASVTLTNLAQAQSQNHLTDTQGNFLFDNLNPGSYFISVTYRSVKQVFGFSLSHGCFSVSPRLNLIESPMLITATMANAPQIYQDTDDTMAIADYITKFDFDGDWIGTDNWNDLDDDRYPKHAYVYWNGSETDSHYFVQYYLFYPRDWGGDLGIECIKDPAEEIKDDINLACHENDMEGIAIAVDKTDRTVQIVTVPHDIKQMTEKCSRQSVGGIQVRSDAKGHATYCKFDPSSYQFPGGDGIIYRFGGISEVPSSANDRDVKYDLISTQQLFDKRFSTDRDVMFAENGQKFLGNDYGDNKASTPWTLDFNLLAGINSRVLPQNAAVSVSSVYVGSLYSDPARVFSTLFPTITFSSDYIYNPNLSRATNFKPDSTSVTTSPLNDAILVLPFGALNKSGIISLTYAMSQPINSQGSATQNGEYFLAGRPINIEVGLVDGSAPTQFNAPASIEFNYSKQFLGEIGLDSESLQIEKWSDGDWHLVPTIIEANASKAISYVDSPGIYALFAKSNIKRIFLPNVFNKWDSTLLVQTTSPTPPPTSAISSIAEDERRNAEKARMRDAVDQGVDDALRRRGL